MTVEEKAAFTAGADFWTLVANERVGIPPIRVTDGPNGARGSALFGLGGETAVCVPCGSALGATWDPELVERVGRDARRGGAHQGVPRAAGADGQPAPLAARRPQLRVLLRGPAALGEDRGRVRARGAVAGRRHHGEALRRQRRRVRAPEHQLGDRRPHAARAHAGAVRARGARGRRARDHDRVQPAQRSALLGAPPAHHRDPARRVGLRGLRAHRLVERGLHRRLVGRGPRPRDAGAGRVLREAPGRRGARRRRARGRARRARHAPARRCSTASARSTTIPRGRARRSTGPSTACSRGRPRPRRPCCCATSRRPAVRPIECAHARGPGPERRTPADDGRRLGQPRAALRDQPARRAARQARRRRRRALRAGRRHRPHHRAAVRAVRDRVLRRPRARAASRSRGGRYRNGKLLVVDPLPPGVEPGQLLVPRHRDLRPRRDRHAHVRAGADGRAAGASSSTARSCSTASPTRPVPAPSSSASPAPRRSRRSSSKPGRRSRSWSSSRSRPTRSSCGA